MVHSGSNSLGMKCVPLFAPFISLKHFISLFLSCLSTQFIYANEKGMVAPSFDHVFSEFGPYAFNRKWQKLGHLCQGSLSWSTAYWYFV